MAWPRRDDRSVENTCKETSADIGGMSDSTSFSHDMVDRRKVRSNMFTDPVDDDTIATLSKLSNVESTMLMLRLRRDNTERLTEEISTILGYGAEGDETEIIKLTETFEITAPCTDSETMLKTSLVMETLLATRVNPRTTVPPSVIVPRIEFAM